MTNIGVGVLIGCPWGRSKKEEGRESESPKEAVG